MNDEKRFFRRFEFWLIVVAVAIATVLLGLGGCGAAVDSVPPAEPEASPIMRTFKLSRFVQVVEFRDSAGRVCVAILSGSVAASSLRPVALDCGRLALDYERLPEPEITPIPERGRFRSERL